MFGNFVSYKKVLLGFLIIYLLVLSIMLAIRLYKNRQAVSQSSSQAYPMKDGCLTTRPISFKEVSGTLDSIDNNYTTINGNSYNLKSTLKVYQVKSKPLSVIYQVDQLSKYERIEVDKTQVKVGDRVSGLDICNVAKDPQAEKGIFVIYIFKG